MKGTIRLLAGGLVAVFVCARLCFATIINVPGDQPTIQAGINAATTGDTVLVAPGTYGGFLLEHKIVTVLSTDGAGASTIQGGASIWFSWLLIRGFTLIGPGFINFNSDASGGTIMDCVFDGDGDGTAVRVGDDYAYISPSILNCTIRNMEYGVVTGAEASATVTGCRFEDNQTAMSGVITATNDTISGGVNGLLGPRDPWYRPSNVTECVFEYLSGSAIQASNYTNLMNCEIRNITGLIAEIDAWGVDTKLSLSGCNMYSNQGGILISGDGGMGIMNPALEMNHCLYYDNSGGISKAGTGTPGVIISSSTFVGNLPDTLIALASSVHYSIVAQLTSSVIAFNAGIGLCIDSDTAIIISCCDVYANAGGNYAMIPDQTGLNGNVSLDPLFCHPDTGNFYLAVNSPCAAENNDCSINIGVFGIDCPEQHNCDCTGYCDMNGTPGFTPLDVVYIVNHVYKQLDARPALPNCPGDNGDWDCSGAVTPLDVTWYVQFVYRQSGVVPCDPCNCDPYPGGCPVFPE